MLASWNFWQGSGRYGFSSSSASHGSQEDGRVNTDAERHSSLGAPASVGAPVSAPLGAGPVTEAVLRKCAYSVLDFDVDSCPGLGLRVLGQLSKSKSRTEYPYLQRTVSLTGLNAGSWRQRNTCPQAQMCLANLSSLTWPGVWHICTS